MKYDVETVHVALGDARAERICAALRLLGQGERVIGLPGDLSLGPINPPDWDVRREWIKSVLSCDPHELEPEMEEPWTEATSSEVYPAYWVCMSDAAEQVAFLEFTFRMTGRPFDVVDATGLSLVTERGVERPWSEGLMSSDDISASRL